MPIEEQAEEKIQNAVQTIITGGAKLMLRIPKGVAMALLRSGMKLTKTGVHAAGEAVKNKIDSGEMSEKRLQRKKDGDLHELQLDDSTMREVQHSLKTAGIDYHLERTDQGQFILHFAGQGGNGRQQRQRLPFIIGVTQCSSPFRDSALDCVGAGIAIPDRYHCNPVSRTPVWTFAQETGKGRPTDVRGTALKEKRSRPA